MVQEGKAYVHAALALYYAGSQINEENLKKVVEALGLQVDEARVKMLVASLSQINLEEVLKGAAVVAAPTAAPAAAPAAQPASQAAESKKEEAKEEKKEASEVDISEGLAGLFGM